MCKIFLKKGTDESVQVIPDELSPTYAGDDRMSCNSSDEECRRRHMGDAAHAKVSVTFVFTAADLKFIYDLMQFLL
jgi:hypothetical protein